MTGHSLQCSPPFPLHCTATAARHRFKRGSVAIAGGAGGDSKEVLSRGTVGLRFSVVQPLAIPYPTLESSSHHFCTCRRHHHPRAGPCFWIGSGGQPRVRPHLLLAALILHNCQATGGEVESLRALQGPR